MLAGPTVRRLHRERGAPPVVESPSHRRRSGASPETRHAPPSRDRAPTPDILSVRPTRAGFPYGMTSLLNMDRYPDVVVLDGEIIHITWKRARAGEDQVAINRTHARARPGGNLDESLRQAYQAHRDAVCQWVRVNGPGSRHLGLDTGRAPLRADTQDSIGSFLRKELMPRLEQEARGRPPATPMQRVSPAATAPESPAGPLALPNSEVLDSGRWWAYFGECWYQLVPFAGRRDPGRLHLTVGRQEFAQWRRTKRSWMLERQNRRLEKAMVTAVGPSRRGTDGETSLYDDGRYSVIQTAMGRRWVVLRVPPYVVEGGDRLLYRFGAAEIGICLTGDKVPDVIHGSAACVTQPYAHMFVLGGDSGSPICMPRSAQYFRRLHRLSLAEAILQHLESARLTLCSGLYHQNGSNPYHQIEAVAQKRISADEARQLQLPIYRYYRN